MERIFIHSKTSKNGTPYLHTTGNQETLVLIHGLGEIKEGWVNQFELADKFNLVIPDLRGHGENNNTDISMQGFAKDIIELLEELAIDSAHILGLSMGGAVAQEIYRQKPSICKSLILNSTFHYLPTKLGRLVVSLVGRKAGDTIEKASKTALYSWKHKDEFKKYFNPRKEEFVKSAHECVKVNNLDLLPNIKVPTLVIGCQYDSILPPLIQLHMHKLIPNSKFVILRNSGHIAKIERKDKFNKIIREFLGGRC
jgi:pimeloyl-ACP methyl ester carboxylesterase